MSQNQSDALFILERYQSTKRLKQSLVLTLSLMIICFFVFKHLPKKPTTDIAKRPIQIVLFDEIPKTKQKYRESVPLQPQIPIASEDEFIPDDETIDITEVDLEEDVTFSFIGNDIVDFEPVFESSEEAETETKSGIVKIAIMVNVFGQVDSVKVIENTTRSKRLENEAIRSAYSMRYIHDEKKEVDQPQWFEHSFHF